MNDFTFYFSLGWRHIISWNALDHILFITALTAIYLVNNWKQVLVQVTAFTVGHTLTLVLSVTDAIRINSSLVEFLIPLTIVSTAFINLLQKNYTASSVRINYVLALFFGLVHGLGYANTIRFMLAKDQQIAMPLFGFNVGLELGQLMVVAVILSASYLLVNNSVIQRKWWVGAISVITICWSGYLAFQRWPF